MLNMVLIYVFGFTAHSVVIGEPELLKLASERTPQKIQMQIEALAKQSALGQNQLQYQTRLNAQLGYSHSAEEALIQFQPVLGPTNNFEIGIGKKTASGFRFSTELFGQQLSTPDKMIDHATQGGIRVAAEMDLLSNWLGKQDKTQSQALKSDLLKSKEFFKLNSHRYEYGIRQLYWQLVANSERTRVTKKLLGTAKKQSSDLSKRSKLGVASVGDVARAKAQVQNRKTSLLLLEYEKVQLIKALKKILPQLEGQPIKLAKYNYAKISENVLMCIVKIKQQKNFDKKWTSISQILGAMEKKHKADSDNVEQIARPSLKVKAQYQLSNADKNYGQAFKDSRSSGYSAMLIMSIPLGSSDNDLRQSQRALINNQFDAEARQLQSLLQTEYSQINRSLEILALGLAAIEKNNRLLKVSLNDMKKKYKQARANMTQLIFEQETFFSSSMREIDVRLQVIIALLEYFKTFDKFPCDVNHVEVKS